MMLHLEETLNLKIMMILQILLLGIQPRSSSAFDKKNSGAPTRESSTRYGGGKRDARFIF